MEAVLAALKAELIQADQEALVMLVTVALMVVQVADIPLVLTLEQITVKGRMVVSESSGPVVRDSIRLQERLMSKTKLLGESYVKES